LTVAAGSGGNAIAGQGPVGIAPAVNGSLQQSAAYRAAAAATAARAARPQAAVPPPVLSAGGAGGQVTATVPVIAGHSLTAFVGIAGSDGVPGTGTSPVDGGYFGGGRSGSIPDVDTPGGSGGGGSFVFDNSTLVAAAGGGGGGAGGSAYTGPNGAGGAGGTTGAAPAMDLTADPLAGGAASKTAGGAAGADNSSGTFGAGTGVMGSAGTGPTTLAGGPGQGGDGAQNPAGSFYGTAGGGGGGFYGGGGGGTDGPGGFVGAGGGGSGYLSAQASAVKTGTNIGDGVVTISYRQAVTTTKLTVSPPSGITVGASTTLVATVTSSQGGPAVGVVTFTDGSKKLGTASISNGKATLSVKLAVGSHSLKAAYAGSTGYLGSRSAAAAYVVLAAEQAAVLANTGSSNGTAVGLGGILIALGFAMVIGARRIRPRSMGQVTG
jgi:LPXTG-motif cell wall-anchored protein